jgi:hypothetical protein
VRYFIVPRKKTKNTGDLPEDQPLRGMLTSSATDQHPYDIALELNAIPATPLSRGQVAVGPEVLRPHR